MIVEGEHPRGSVLFMANHLHPHFLLPRLVEINYKLPSRVVFVCDATFKLALNLFGLRTIGLDMRNYSKRINSTSSKIIATIGMATGAYITATRSDESVCKMANALKSGSDILIFPSASTGQKYPWRSGVARVCQLIDPEKNYGGFIYIPSNSKNETQVLYAGTIASLIRPINLNDINNLTTQLRSQYDSRMSLRSGTI